MSFPATAISTHSQHNRESWLCFPKQTHYAQSSERLSLAQCRSILIILPPAQRNAPCTDDTAFDQQASKEIQIPLPSASKLQAIGLFFFFFFTTVIKGQVMGRWGKASFKNCEAVGFL